MSFLPVPTWPVAPRDTINESATSAVDLQASVAAENAPLRVIYGQVRLGPLIACVLPYVGGTVIMAIWGHGECQEMVQCTIDDKAIPATVTATHYMGTSAQLVNATLTAAFLENGKTWADALPGICYSVFQFYLGLADGFPNINAVIKGRKVWTGAANVWSDNPAYCLADFITDNTYGCARTVDWASVASVASDCNALVGVNPNNEKLRTLNLVLDTVQPVSSWIETLRTYAGCWIVPSGSELKLVSDKVGTSVASLSHTSGQIQSVANIKKRGVTSMPTVMTVTYTYVTQSVTTNSVVSYPAYKDKPAVVYADGVIAGTTPRRESQVSLPGINRYSQAYREAVERINKLVLNDLSLNVSVFDEGLALDFGDIVSLTWPLFGAAKLFRVMGITGEYGRYALALVEYDPAVYSAVISTTPTYPDTTLSSPGPGAPPAVTGVVMAEEVFQQQDGTYSSRWRVTWTAVAFGFLDHYRAELWIGALMVQSASPSGAEWPTGALQEEQNYTVKVAAVSSIGAIGTWGTQSAVAAGKTLPPGNVPSVSAFEAGGRVYVSWTPAVDIDIWRYEVRYGAVGVAWANTLLLDRTDSLRLQSDQIPTGTWTLHVKALDSVQGYSVTAATCNVTVTSDAGSFLIARYDQSAPTMTNMAEYLLARDDANRYWVSEDAALWNTKYSSTLNTYSNVLATYHASMTSTWLGEAEDFGLLLGGNWTGTATVADVSGSHLSYLGNSLDGSTWAYPSGLSQKVNSRFARLKHEALTTATMLVTIPTQSIRIDAIPREEVGSGTSSAAGPVTITLETPYVAVKKLTITPQGTTARSATFDKVLINGTAVSLAGAGTEVLQFNQTLPAGSVGNSFHYWHFSNATAYTTQAGDRLRFDYLPVKGVAGAFVSVCLYNGVWDAGTNLAQPTISASPGTAWASVDAGVTAGYAITHCALVNEGDVPGDYSMLLRNVRITDSSNVTRRVLWDSGVPTDTSTWLINQYTQAQVGPANSFDVYVFNDAGVKIASAFQYQFQGV